LTPGGTPEFGCSATAEVAELLAIPPNVVGVSMLWWPPKKKNKI